MSNDLTDFRTLITFPAQSKMVEGPQPLVMTNGTAACIKKQKPQPSWQVSLGSMTERWLHALNNRIATDMAFRCGDSEELIPAHRILLILHSPVFETMLSSRWSLDDTEAINGENMVISGMSSNFSNAWYINNLKNAAKKAEKSQSKMVPYFP